MCVSAHVYACLCMHTYVWAVCVAYVQIDVEVRISPPPQSHRPGAFHLLLETGSLLWPGTSPSRLD